MPFFPLAFKALGRDFPGLLGLDGERPSGPADLPQIGDVLSAFIYRSYRSPLSTELSIVLKEKGNNCSSCTGFLAVPCKKHLTLKEPAHREKAAVEEVEEVAQCLVTHLLRGRRSLGRAQAPSRSWGCHVFTQFLSGHVQKTGGKFSKGSFSGEE